MTKPLSPAQAVLDAYNSHLTANFTFDRPVSVHHKPRIAAALRAAASQLTSAKAMLQLRAIAAELEALDA